MNKASSLVLSWRGKVRIANQFWRLAEYESFAASEVALYAFLLNECNKFHWQMPFSCPTFHVCNRLRMSKQNLFLLPSNKALQRSNISTSLRLRFIAIDDFGIEGTFYDYGNPHIVFSEIVDGIEKHGTLLVTNTNLTLEEVKVKYGLRTFDRLRANMQVVVIREKSLRGKYEKCF